MGSRKVLGNGMPGERGVLVDKNSCNNYDQPFKRSRVAHGAETLLSRFIIRWDLARIEPHYLLV